MTTIKLDVSQVEAFLKALMGESLEEEPSKEEVSAKIQEIRSRMPWIVRELFDIEKMKKAQCAHHPETRIVPTNGRDWRAVDNLMCSIWLAYAQAMAEYIRTLDTALIAAQIELKRELHPSVRIQIADIDAYSTVLYTVLESHFLMCRELSRDNENADLHYDRIINQAVPIVERHSKKEKSNGEPRSSD